MSWFSDEMFTDKVECTEDESNYIECHASSELVGTTLRLLMTPVVEDHQEVLGEWRDMQMVYTYTNMEGAGIEITPPSYDMTIEQNYGNSVRLQIKD